MPSVKAKTPTPNWGAVRVERYEIAGLTKEQRERWWSICDGVKQITNFIWQEWLMWHCQRDAQSVIKSFLDEYSEWKATPKKSKAKRPKLPIQAFPKELSSHVGKGIKERFPEIHTRISSLTMNALASKIATRKASKGSLSGWLAILLYHESIPSSTRPIPIPFDVQNSTIVPPANKDTDFAIDIRLTRKPRAGKMATSDVETIKLNTKKRKTGRQRSIIAKCATGEYKFCGSSLLYDTGKRKWYMLLCWRAIQEKPVGLDPELTAYLAPSPLHKKHPWRLRIDGQKVWPGPGGNGAAVGATRRQISLARRSMQNGFRWASSARKGHGRDRGQGCQWKLQKSWKEFVKRVNHLVTTYAVRQCVERGCGTLVYFQPDGKLKDGRFLSATGKVAKVKENTSWDWFQVGSLLSYKCKAEGIQLVVRKAG